MLKLLRASLALVVACGTGCALLLDGTTAPGDRCRFAGDDSTDCGACLAAHCQEAIDRCCGNASCQATLTALDRCAGSADIEACHALPAAVGSGDVAACLASACASECAAGKSRARCEQSGTSCTCLADTPDDNGVQCSAPSLGGICCADLGYPATGLSCSCGTYACQATEDSCACTLDGTGGDSVPCEGSICCRSIIGCRCGSEACDGDEDEVLSCSDPGCTSDRSQVSSCSITEN